MLLLPSWQESARIIGVGVLLPLVVYYLYTRSPLGGREYGMFYMRWRFLTEMGLVTLLLAWLPGMLARRYVRRRCRQLGVPVDAEKQTMWRIVRYLLGALLFVAVNIGMLLLGAVLTEMIYDRIYEWAVHLFVTYVCTLVLGDLLFLRWLIPRARQRQREAGPRVLPANALYRGTVARSLVPVYAFAIVLLAMTVQPYLLHQEAKWLRADRIFFPREDSGLFMPIETRVVRQLQAEMLQAAEEIEKSK